MLHEIGAGDIPQILVWNKIDCTAEGQPQAFRAALEARGFRVACVIVPAGESHGLICIGAGLPLGVQMSPLLTLLSLGVATRWMDVRGDVVGLRISSDARVFLVITFVLAGAALEIGLIVAHWREVAAFALARIAGRMLALRAAAGPLGVDAREAHWLGIGLLPKSSIALVLLGNAGPLSGDVGERLANVLLGAIALMQLVGPICTQMCSRGLGEARRLKGADPVTWMLARLPRRNG